MKERKEKGTGPIDWVQVYRRMEKTKESLDKGGSADEAEKKRILKARARALAEPGAVEPEERIEIVEFLLSSERYGIESRYVREVCPLREFAQVPCTPPFVLGVMNVRGEIISIIDIRKFFDLPEPGLGDLNRVIIVSSEQMEFGILADTIAGIRVVPVGSLLPPPPTFTGVRREYLEALAADGTTILDAVKILSDQRIVINEFV